MRAVFFNGRTARMFWDRRVAGSQDLPDGLALTTLPSTSPANAALTRAEKTEAWRQVVAAARPTATEAASAAAPESAAWSRTGRRAYRSRTSRSRERRPTLPARSRAVTVRT